MKHTHQTNLRFDSLEPSIPQLQGACPASSNGRAAKQMGAGSLFGVFSWLCFLVFLFEDASLIHRIVQRFMTHWFKSRLPFVDGDAGAHPSWWSSTPLYLSFCCLRKRDILKTKSLVTVCKWAPLRGKESKQFHPLDPEDLRPFLPFRWFCLYRDLLKNHSGEFEWQFRLAQESQQV